MPIQNFKEIIVWQKAHFLALRVYEITKDFPATEIYNLVSQMRRSATSVPCNIAEGFKRMTAKDQTHFYCIAEGSLEELKYQLLLSRDLGYISAEVYFGLNDSAEEVGRMLNTWKKCSHR